MILEPARSEVCAKPATCSGGDTCSPKEGHGDPAVGVAARSNASGGRSGLVKWLRVEFACKSKEPLRISLVDGFELSRIEFNAVEGFGDYVVDEQALHDLDDFLDVGRKSAPWIERGKAARFGVEGQRFIVHVQSLSQGRVIVVGCRPPRPVRPGRWGSSTASNWSRCP